MNLSFSPSGSSNSIRLLTGAFLPHQYIASIRLVINPLVILGHNRTAAQRIGRSHIVQIEVLRADGRGFSFGE